MNAKPFAGKNPRELNMSSIMKELKAEISRLARKEVKKEIGPVQRVSAARRSLIADLRRQIAALQRDVADLRRALSRGGSLPLAVQPAASAEGDDGRKGFWITGKGVRAMRKKVGLTQEKFGKLVGVSVPTVVNWEKAKGKLNLRKAAAGALQGLRGKGKREVAEMLPKEAKEPKAKAKAKK